MYYSRIFYTYPLYNSWLKEFNNSNQREKQEGNTPHEILSVISYEIEQYKNIILVTILNPVL